MESLQEILNSFVKEIYLRCPAENSNLCDIDTKESVKDTVRDYFHNRPWIKDRVWKVEQLLETCCLQAYLWYRFPLEKGARIALSQCLVYFFLLDDLEPDWMEKIYLQNENAELDNSVGGETMRSFLHFALELGTFFGGEMGALLQTDIRMFVWASAMEGHRKYTPASDSAIRCMRRWSIGGMMYTSVVFHGLERSVQSQLITLELVELVWIVNEIMSYSKEVNGGDENSEFSYVKWMALSEGRSEKDILEKLSKETFDVLDRCRILSGNRVEYWERVEAFVLGYVEWYVQAPRYGLTGIIGENTRDDVHRRRE